MVVDAVDSGPFSTGFNVECNWRQGARALSIWALGRDAGGANEGPHQVALASVLGTWAMGDASRNSSPNLAAGFLPGTWGPVWELKQHAKFDESMIYILCSSYATKFGGSM